MTEIRYRCMFETAGEGILFMDAGTGMIEDVNPALMRLLGYSREELAGKKFWEAGLFADGQAGRALFESLLKDGEVRLESVTLEKKDRNRIQAGLAASVFTRDESKIIQCTIRGMGESKEQKAPAGGSAKYFLSLLDNIEDIVMALSLDGSIMFMSQSIKTFGYTPEEVTGHNIYDYMHPEDLETAMKANIYSVQNPGKTTLADIRMLHKDGRYIMMAGIGKTVIPESGPPFILINGRDIAARVMIEEALRESNENLRTIIDASPLAVLSVNLDGIILNWNRAAEQIFGWTESEAVGHTLPIVPPEKMKEYLELRARILQGSVVNGAEVERMKKDGSLIHISVSGGPVFNRDGNAESIIYLVSDISERKRAEEELRRYKDQLEELVAERTSELVKVQEQLLHSQKMEAVGQLAGGIAHDFNNILAVIIGTGEFLLKGMPGSDQARKHIERINKVANRGKDLTMNLLTFARKDKLDIRAISTDDLVMELKDLLNRSVSKTIDIKAERCAQPPLLMVDVNQVLQALLNVSINACDAMPENGTLVIESARVELDEKDCVDIFGAVPGKHCRISITDTGTGIPKDIGGRIFEPFFTTKEKGKGTGLGLPISLGIIQNHKGGISIESEQGKGTRMNIFLPLLEGPVPLRAAPEAVEQKAPAKGTVMVVDDDQDFLDIISDTLRDNGIDVIPAPGAARALELYRRRWREIDLVILDIMMPEMDGVEVFHLLKTMNPDIRVIVCSGYSKDGKASGIITHNSCAYLQKPFSSSQLNEAVSAMLDQPGASASGSV